MRTPIATVRLVAMVLVGLLSAGCGALGVGSTGPNEPGTRPVRRFRQPKTASIVAAAGALEPSSMWA